MKSSRFPRWGGDVLWQALLCLYIMGGAAIVPFHGDESSKIYIGRDYYYLFLEGDRSKLSQQSKRSDNSSEYHTNLASGSISNMIYGWLAASSGYAMTELNKDWHWGLDYSENLASERVPEARLLRSARLASAAQLAAAAALLYIFACMTISRPTAWLASLLFAIHPSLLLNGRRALQEGSHMLGTMLVLVMAAWIIRQGRWWQYALLGICAGWAIAAKHTSAFLVALVFLALGALSVYEQLRASDKRKLGPLAGLSMAGLMVSIITLLVFYLLNPGWWDAPLQSAQSVMSERAALLQRQVGVYGGYQSLGQQVKGYYRFVLLGERQYYEDQQWAGYPEISRQIQHYEGSGWAGAAIGGNALLALAMSLLVAGGIFLLLGDCYVSLRNSALLLWGGGIIPLSRACAITWQNRALVLFWGGGITALVFALTPLPWARYYLPVLPFTLMMASYALTSMAQIIANYMYAPRNAKQVIQWTG